MSDTTQDTEALRILRQIAPQIANIEERLGRVEDRLTRLEVKLDTTLPFLATKADVAAKPGRAELWAAIGAMTAMFAVVLTALSVLLPHLTKAGG